MSKYRKPITISLENWFLKAYPVNQSELKDVTEALDVIDNIRTMLSRIEEEYKERQAYLAIADPDSLPTRNGIDY